MGDAGAPTTKRAKAVGKPAAGTLVDDIRRLIAEARTAAAAAVNAGLTLLYWRVGLRIRREVLGEKRAEYGREIFVTLSRELVGEHGQGFSAAVERASNSCSWTGPAFALLNT